MKIHSVRIKNFRALKDVSIEFDSVTTFIGPNGAGKSTVLRALDWFFNGEKNGALSDTDCNFGASDDEIQVQVTFGDLTEKDRQLLGRYAPVGAKTSTAWKTRSTDGSESFSANAKSYRAFNEIREKVSATDKKAAYGALRKARPELELPAWTRQEDSLQELVTWEANHTDQLVEAPETQTTKFFGFNSDGKMSDLLDFVLVTADLRASEEAQDSRSSVIGKILERSVDRTAADKEIAQIIEESRAAQQMVYHDKFRDQLNTIKTRLNKVVATYSPGRSIEISPAEIELKAAKTAFDVSVIDGAAQTAVDRQGHGFQRTLLISALQVLAESTAAGTDCFICLAVEEPELFQHPTQAQAFARVLRELADDTSKRIQVMYATHSPYFLEARHFDQIRRLTRSSGTVPTAIVHSSTLDKVKSCLTGIVNPDGVGRQLDLMTSGQLASAMFASRALVVEGTTDAAVFYGLGDREAAAKLEAEGIAVVSANGKMSVPLAHAVLESLGIPTYAVFDADAGFESRASQKSPSKIAAERTEHSSRNRKLLRYFSLSEEDFPGVTVADNVAIFEDDLESFLRAKWPEWTTACTNIEEATGATLTKNQLAYRTATANADGEAPSMLKKVLEKVRGV